METFTFFKLSREQISRWGFWQLFLHCSFSLDRSLKENYFHNIFEEPVIQVTSTNTQVEHSRTQSTQISKKHRKLEVEMRFQ